MPVAAERPDLLAAALAYATRGWPVFPCSPESKRPLVGALPGEPRGSGGLHRATTTADLIRSWWRKWPKAMIGVPTGARIGAFVLDLDVGDPPLITAGVYLDRLIAHAMGIPPTAITLTPRGGYHVWFAWQPEYDFSIGSDVLPALRIDQPAGAVPEHGAKPKPAQIDARGEGGYVIVPPSVTADGRAYEWLQPIEDGLAAASAQILAIADRSERKAAKKITTVGDPRRLPGSSSSPAPAAIADEAVRKYALAAFDLETRKLAAAPDGSHNMTTNEVAFSLGTLVGAGALAEGMVRAALQEIVHAWPNWRRHFPTIESGLSAGIASPRDLRSVRDKVRPRRAPPLRVVGATAEPLPPKHELREEAQRPETDQLEMRDILRQQRRRLDPPPLEARNGHRAGDWTPDRLGLPREDPCPVIPLGFEGELMHFLNSSGQLVGWTEQRFTHAGIQKIFAAMPNYPEWMCPRPGKAKTTTNPDTGETSTFFPIESFKDDAVRKLLFRAIDRKGMFSPAEKVRGRGAWRMADGAIYYHAGEELWIVEGGRIRAIETGIVHDGGADLVFPRMAALPPPWPKAVESAENPARQLIEGFRKWNWDMPEVAPVLLLGWIGVGFLGGALDWRSAVSLIGDKGTGKSALQQLIKELFGDALFDRANTSAADIYQHLSHDSRAVAVDEMEASADNRKLNAVIELMRQASSGAMGGRGGADGTGSEFQMRSAFLFSAINNPPLNSQDLSRIALLRLRELPRRTNGEAQAPPVIIDAEICGRKILGRLLLEWHRFAKTLAAYKNVLETVGGHVGRGGDTYGTLLAAADLILGPELAEELGIPMVDDLARWGELLNVDLLPEIGDATPNYRACIDRLQQATVPTWRGGRRSSVGQVIEDLDDPESGLEVSEATRLLADAGLGLRRGERGWVLAVPIQHAKVAELFKGTRWEGTPGAGVWSEALRQAPHDVCSSERKKNRMRIGGVLVRCIFIDLTRLNEEDDNDGN